MYADKDYIINLRHEIHEYPEIGFDLPKTISVVKRELEKLNVPYSESYGESSVVGVINPNKKGFTIGIRADMDALPIEEKADIPFKSKIKGQMHACGHDAHTAMLLGTAKALKEMEDKIDCRVLLIFQPSEEGVRSGAKELVDGGLMDEVDVIVGLHVENWLPSGTIGVCAGSSMASSRNFKVNFYGATAHASLPQSGVDALSAIIKTYNDIHLSLAREVNPFEQYVFSVGKLEGGTTQNVIADYAYMIGTIRTFNNELDDYIIKKLEKIANLVASETGARAEVETSLQATVLYNDPYLSSLALKSAEKIVGKDGIVKMNKKLSSEDFSHYVSKKPGVFMRLGTKNEEKGCVTLPHNNDFLIDEDAFEIGTNLCVQFVLDNMKGIDADKLGEKLL